MRLERLLLCMGLCALTSCSSNKLTESPAPPVGPPPPALVATQAAQPAAPAQQSQTAVKTVTVHPLDDPGNALVKRTIYFDFDSFAIHDTDRPLVDAHARYLSISRTAKVRIEGNADERGGREYNLALGQRRAESVVKALRLLGVPNAEMEATSYGKERPVDPGHNEAAWSKNRRADFNYINR